MNKTRRTLTTGLKLAICLVAVLAIGYTQTWVENWGGSYGGSLATQVACGFWNGLPSDLPFWPCGGSFWSMPLPQFYGLTGQETQIGFTDLLLLLLIAGWLWWHRVWTEALQRERRLAAELRPMYRLVSSPPRRTKKPQHHPSGAPAWH